MTPRHYGDIIFDAFDRGTQIKGAYELKCPEGDIQPSSYEGDGCPDTRLIGLCDIVGEERNRLCARCPVEVTLTNATGGSDNFCFWGNILTPFKDANNMRMAWKDEETPWLRDVVYLEHEEDGCRKENYADFQGKVVVVPESGSCLSFEQMRQASLAGVAAFVLLPPGSAIVAPMVEGLSLFSSIPVHAMHPEETTRFRDFVTSGGRQLASAGETQVWQVSASIVPGAASTQQPTPAPTSLTVVERIAVEERKDFEWTTSVIVAFVFIVLLVAGIGLKFYEGNLNSVHIPAEFVSKEGKIKIPLNCASMTLSLTLLVVTAVVVFVLAYTAGRDSTNTAIDEGGKAVDTCHSSSVDNVQELATKLRQGAIRSASQAVSDLLKSGETVVELTAQLYAFYDGTYESFDSVWDLHVVQAQAMATRSIGEWVVGAKTIQGFYSDGYSKTDWFTPDDGPNVTVTQDGHLHDYITHWYDEATKRGDPWARQPRNEWPVEQRIGNFYGDPIGLMRGKPSKFYHWQLTWYNLENPMQESTNQAVSVLTPLYGEGNVFYGAVETNLWAPYITGLAQDAVLGGDTGGQGEKFKDITDNLTMVAYDAVDGKMIATSRGYSYTVRDQIQTHGVQESMTLQEVYIASQNALGSYIRRINGGNWTGLNRTGEFDQKDEYTPQNHQVWLFDFANGDLTDATPNNYKAEVRDGSCGSCMGQGHTGGGLQLDGRSMLYVYRNLSVDKPRVIERRAKNFQPYEFSCYVFERECVSVSTCPAGPCSCPGREGCGDEAVANYDPRREMWFPMLIDPFTRKSASLAMWINPSEEIAAEAFPSPQEAPRLFSDTYFGDGFIRWFANGVLYVRIGNLYGCLTRPIPGGPKVGVWTHVAAVVDHWWEKCFVYVNGELHDERTLTYRFRRWTNPPPDIPMTVGYRFNGAMDDITGIALAISQADVQRMMNEQGRYKAVVASRRWLMEFTPFIREDDTHSGINWVIAAMIPREDVMRSVDENNRLLRANLRISEENTRKELNQRTYDTIFIAIAIALASVIIFFIFNDFLTRPFAQLACDMLDVAVLKTDNFELCTSNILELNAMMRAMFLMVENMKMYKKFMPASLLVNYEQEEDSEVDSEYAASQPTVQKGVTNVLVRPAGATSPRAGTGSPRADNQRRSRPSIKGRKSVISRGSRGSSTGSSRSAAKSFASSRIVGPRRSSAVSTVISETIDNFAQKQKGGGMAMGLQRKRITALTVNVNEWHEITARVALNIAKLHRRIMDSIISVVQSEKGIPETFQGDRLWSSWNAVKPMVSHRLAACRAAIGIKEALAEDDPADQGATKVTTCMSLVSGEVRCGNVGTETMCKYTYFGGTIPWTYALERYARSIATDFALADDQVYHEVKDSFGFRVAAAVKFAKRHKHKTFLVFQLLRELGAGDVDEQEWMYRLEQAEQNNPWRDYDAAWEFIMKGDPEKAKATIQAVPSPGDLESAPDQSKRIEILLDMKVRAAAESSCGVDEILYH
eukprot:TRINITY_DN24_c0_g2_i1.p1 TRINITY_DN24_c0_g2~~TRINITY_DN24_c0_g2_i1.p1  ORF type:complete len:1753 (+),score=421.83 TRINITY_DN24_c0_g2_i1:765-5261(+)